MSAIGPQGPPQTVEAQTERTFDTVLAKQNEILSQAQELKKTLDHLERTICGHRPAGPETKDREETSPDGILEELDVMQQQIQRLLEDSLGHATRVLHKTGRDR